MITINFKGEQTRLKITTVVLEVDRDKWNYLKMFHCYQCRNPVLKHSGEVVEMVPGGDIVDLPIIVQCSVCKRNFNFISIVESV